MFEILDILGKQAPFGKHGEEAHLYLAKNINIYNQSRYKTHRHHNLSSLITG
jgi:hypothetical protein